jgi:opacity protein-like surface antigen
MKKIMMMAVTAALLMAPLAASARVAVFVGPRVGFGWYAPYWGPYPYYGYYPYGPNTGDIKFDTHDKNEQVYINGAYAGTVGEVKTMHLRPGNYDVEVREQGRTQFDENVYVAAGKTLHLRPDAEQP